MQHRLNAIHITVWAVLLTIALVVFASEGVRGTDQYWYVADTQSLIDGDKSQTTNMYFPGKLLRERESPSPNYFMHNGYAIKIAAYIGEWFGAYRGWIVLNTVLHLFAAACVFVSCNLFLKPVSSAWIVVFYLLSPIAIWQTVNPLLEQSYAVITAFFLVGYLYHTRIAGALTLFMAMAIGVISHPIFLPPAIGIILFFAWRMYSANSRFYLLCLCVSTLTLGWAYFFGKSIFPSSFQPNLEAIITSAIPGESNMFWHYSLDQHSISLELMMNKLTAALEKHLLTPRMAPFYLFTNIAVVLGTWLMFTRFKKLFWLILPAGIFYGLYFSIIFLQQNHPRYQHIVSPITFIILAIFVSQSSLKVHEYLKYLLLAGVLFVNGFMLTISRGESKVEAVDLSDLGDKLDSVEGLNSLVTLDIMPHNPLSYTVRPASLLAIRTNMLTENQIIDSLELFGTDHVLSAFEIHGNYLGKNFDFMMQIESAIFGKLFLYSVRD